MNKRLRCSQTRWIILLWSPSRCIYSLSTKELLRCITARFSLLRIQIVLKSASKQCWAQKPIRRCRKRFDWHYRVQRARIKSITYLLECTITFLTVPKRKKYFLQLRKGINTRIGNKLEENVLFNSLDRGLLLVKVRPIGYLVEQRYTFC